jgi:hypothetical protein
MKRFVFAAALTLLCIASPTSVEEQVTKSNVDMSNMNKIFVGWVDLDPDEYRLLDYSTKEDWVGDIEKANAYFQGDLKSGFLAGRTLTMAKNRDDVNAAGNDLYIKFTDVAEDKGYRLHMAIHFIDLKTNAEIAVVPSDVYSARGHFCLLEGCIQIELGKVGKLVSKQIGSKKK